MKKILLTLSTILMGLMLGQSLLAQTAKQTVSITISQVYKISTSGNPNPMTINSGVAGTNALTSVSDASTTYNITQNVGSTVKITANLDAALASGYSLKLQLQSTKGTSAGQVDISATTPTSAVTVVSSIAMGADANQTITYTFGANASAGVLSSVNKVVTLTLTT